MTSGAIVSSAVVDNASYKVDTTAPATPTLTLGTDVSNGAYFDQATQTSGVITVNGEAQSLIKVVFGYSDPTKNEYFDKNIDWYR